MRLKPGFTVANQNDMQCTLVVGFLAVEIYKCSACGACYCTIKHMVIATGRLVNKPSIPLALMVSRYTFLFSFYYQRSFSLFL